MLSDVLMRQPPPPADDDLWSRWRTWTLRFYVGAFITLALLAVARAVRHDAAARIAVKALAGVVGAIAVGMGVYGFSCWVRWRRRRSYWS